MEPLAAVPPMLAAAAAAASIGHKLPPPGGFPRTRQGTATAAAAAEEEATPPFPLLPPPLSPWTQTKVICSIIHDPAFSLSSPLGFFSLSQRCRSNLTPTPPPPPPKPPPHLHHPLPPALCPAKWFLVRVGGHQRRRRSVGRGSGWRCCKALK